MPNAKCYGSAFNLLLQLSRYLSYLYVFSNVFQNASFMSSKVSYSNIYVLATLRNVVFGKYQTKDIYICMLLNI